ncbi:TetR/AcrR family transcriptional regulator [Saccharopolyspora flava]|uniref:Transcriptional regulator, TetR family n=1 Tax=Saccharopolyspora flava TaxID=95161 RepID=A0A1I6NRI7_9PSEU|nr:TetR/AcrR family transcriptional regulator [Saccharopolyspora flava]SFS30519.1 transcriptional regulator, TetR family [Saccharopolyspora flava]
MDPAPPLASENTKTLLERAFSDAVDQVDDSDETTARVLDGAYEQFCRTGIRRSTMDDVAKRAGVSRITVYRRFANKDTLVEHVVRREFRRYFDRFLRDIRQARTLAERLELGFAGSLRAIRENPLIGGLMEVEPDVVVPSMISDGGRTMATVSRFLAERLRIEQRTGHVAAEVDVDLVAEMMVRVSTSFLLTPSELIDLDDEQQVRDIARRFLLPMLEPPA